jgi:hypothetical protein
MQRAEIFGDKVKIDPLKDPDERSNGNGIAKNRNEPRGNLEVPLPKDQLHGK